MTIHPTALAYGKEVAEKAVQAAVTNIDKAAGYEGYAANHPELIKVYMELVLAAYQTNRSGEK